MSGERRPQGPAQGSTLLQPQPISSRDNPLLQRLRKLAQGGSAYRKLGQVWLEGEHLAAAVRLRGGPAAQAVLTEQAWADPALRELAGWAAKAAVVPEALFKTISSLPSQASIGFLIDLPEQPPIDVQAASLVLDRVQDAGNVGSMLRSAAAFGIPQVLALTGTAALWSPKVVRAGMGAHFALRLIEGLDESDLQALEVPLVATSSHAGVLLPQAQLPEPCAWVLGHEGQGVSATLLQACALLVRIPQPGGEESLNAAAAAAICIYESARRRAV